MTDCTQAGFDPRRLARAVAAAQETETSWPQDIRRGLEDGFFEPPPWNEILGPTAPRGGPNGLVLHAGRMVARWGDTRRVDMTFSSAKSYLSLLAGLAVGDGLIPDLDRPISEHLPLPEFSGRHNGAITWRHLLQQTSEWEGTLWGKPDLIDRNRKVGVPAELTGKGDARPLRSPGDFWEYNDVRVNLFSLVLLHLFRRPLAEVFDERIMRVIGASNDWRWEGYCNSEVEIGGRRIRSVPGGGHWGGGVFIHAEDQARLGLLALRGGAWGDRQLIPRSYMREALTPCPLNPLYGALWWLNTGYGKYPSASADSFFALGTGGNITWVDPLHDIVAVLRWSDTAFLDGFIASVYAALSRGSLRHPADPD